MSKCECCKEENMGNGITLSRISYPFGIRETMMLDINMWVSEDEPAEISAYVWSGSVDIAETRFEIKYCPFCGRKFSN